MTSCLEGGAQKVALNIQIVRLEGIPPPQQVSYRGIDAVTLDAADATYDVNGNQITPAYESGCRVPLNRLQQLYYLDDQDLAWTALDKFFTYHVPMA